MNRSNPIEVKHAPDTGMMLAYYRKAVIFDAYSKENLETVFSELEQEKGTLLELHLFDNEKEFRAVLKEDGTYTQSVIADASDTESVTEFVIEEMYLEGAYAKKAETIKVINYLEYKENGMLQVTNYRLTL